MPVDAKAITQDRADADVVAAELNGKKVTLEAALRARSSEMVSGTITVVFDLDNEGKIKRRTTVTKLITKMADGRSEDQTITETLEQKLIAPSAPGDLVDQERWAEPAPLALAFKVEMKVFPSSWPSGVESLSIVPLSPWA